MKLGIFVQNYVQGGMDTFLINLVNNISCDEVFLFYNKGKNIERVKKQLNKKQSSKVRRQKVRVVYRGIVNFIQK